MLRSMLGQLRVSEILADMAWEASPDREYSHPAVLGYTRGFVVKTWAQELKSRWDDVLSWRATMV